MKEKSAFNKDLGKLQAQRRTTKALEQWQHNQKITELRVQHNEPAPIKEIATPIEQFIMIGIVLETGESGTKAIRRYALEANKTEKWINEIAKPKVGKIFANELNRYEDNKVIVSMKENGVYNKKDILKNTLTGALTKLSQQVLASKKIDAVSRENQELKLRLELQASLAGKPTDWGLAQQLKEQGYNVREIAEIMGVSKSAVSNHTKAKQG